MRIHGTLGSLAILFVSLSSSVDAADCGSLKIVNTVQMQRGYGNNRDYIPVQINGRDLQLLFDTGGITTMIDRKAALDMNLPIRQGDVEFYDATGNKSRDQTTVAEFTLGRMRGKDFTFPVSPAESGGGIFSLNFMRPYDVDVDFGTDKLNFFDKDHCPGGVLYWKASAVAVLPITLRDGHMTVPVTLDGQTLTAIIDTGADYSTLRMDLAKYRYHLEMGDQETPEKGVLNGDQSLKTYTHTFKALTFGDISVVNPRLTIIPDAMKRGGDQSQQTEFRSKRVSDDIIGPEVIIGMNVLRRLHIYMAFGENRMYITPASAPQTAPAPAQ